MSSSYRIELDKWLSQLDVKADKVLDIGGAQLPLPKRTRTWDVKEYLIADLPQPHAGSPRPDIELDLNDEDSFNDGTEYEMIFCLEVFDYVWNPKVALELISLLLQKGGTAWVTFPSVYPLHQPVEDDALRYMPAAVKKLATSVGLTVEEIIYRRPETNLWQEFFYAERMRGAKHQNHSFTGMIVRFSK